MIKISTLAVFFVLLLKCEFSTFYLLESFVTKVTRVWSVNHSFHERNENDFSTWFSLGLLLCSVYHIFYKRNENEFFTLVSLGIFLLWSVKYSFHKRNKKPKNYFSPKDHVSPENGFLQKNLTFLLDLVFSCCVVFTTFLYDM